MTFTLSDEQWSPIADMLRNLGHEPSKGDRFELEMHLRRYVKLRGKLGRNLAAPKRYGDAWQAVATAAERLQEAIDGLREARAADFSVLGAEAERCRQSLPGLVSDARYIASIEGQGPKDANNADPFRDNTIKRLLSYWYSRGGELGLSAAPYGRGEPYGPLIRFLTATFDLVTNATGEPKVGSFVLRGVVEKLRGEVRALHSTIQS